MTLNTLLTSILRPGSQEEHWEYGHLSETRVVLRRQHVDEVAKAQAAFTAARDEFARLCTYWGVDAAALEDMTGYAADIANELLGAIRKEYGRE